MITVIAVASLIETENIKNNIVTPNKYSFVKKEKFNDSINLFLLLY